MILPDVNLLIYAVDVEAPMHRRAKQWLEQVLSDPQTVAISWSTVLAFMRLTTSRRMYRAPLPIEVALNTVGTWLAHPSVTLVHPGPKHFSILRELLMAVGTGGSLTSGAHLAALAIENGAELCSSDYDFGRFPRLKWSNPLEGNTLKL
jgi:toxin-antitoxin system PIN domain toxin